MVRNDPASPGWMDSTTTTTTNANRVPICAKKIRRMTVRACSVLSIIRVPQTHGSRHRGWLEFPPPCCTAEGEKSRALVAEIGEYPELRPSLLARQLKDTFACASAD